MFEDTDYRQEGYSAFRRGYIRDDSPYESGTVEDDEWQEGWTDAEVDDRQNDDDES